MKETRVETKDRMKDDFEDFFIKAGCDTYLIHKKSLERVRVEEVVSAKVRISQGSGNCTSWVKATQLLGNFDGEMREGRVGLYKRKNSIPVLVTITNTGDKKCEIKHFNEDEDSTSWEVFTNQVKMASPSTLRGFLKKHKSAAKQKKSNLGTKSGRNFSLESFLKTQTECDETQSERTMQVIEREGNRFEKLLASQQNQINQLINAMRAGATTRIENSSEKKNEDAVKSIEGVEKNDESKGHEDDGSISGYGDLEPSNA